MFGDLVKAREKLWTYQERFNCFPKVNISINDICWFNMAHRSIWSAPPSPFEEPFMGKDPNLSFWMKDYDLMRILNRDVHWNNLEESFAMQVNRVPNIYNPDVHLLLSYFHI